MKKNFLYDVWYTLPNLGLLFIVISPLTENNDTYYWSCFFATVAIFVLYAVGCFFVYKQKGFKAIELSLTDQRECLYYAYISLIGMIISYIQHDTTEAIVWGILSASLFIVTGLPEIKKSRHAHKETEKQP